MSKEQIYKTMCDICGYYTITIIEDEFIFKKNDQIKHTIEYSGWMSWLILTSILYENHYENYILNEVMLGHYLSRHFNNRMNFNFILEGMEALIPIHREMVIDEVLG